VVSVDASSCPKLTWKEVVNEDFRNTHLEKQDKQGAVYGTMRKF